ncbi:MAG TPA: hypothetical protein ACFYEH_02290 [Candidatus Brocadiaceae bacterium]
MQLDTIIELLNIPGYKVAHRVSNTQSCGIQGTGKSESGIRKGRQLRRQRWYKDRECIW